MKENSLFCLSGTLEHQWNKINPCLSIHWFLFFSTGCTFSTFCSLSSFGWFISVSWNCFFKSNVASFVLINLLFKLFQFWCIQCDFLNTSILRFFSFIFSWNYWKADSMFFLSIFSIEIKLFIRRKSVPFCLIVSI